LELSLNKKLFQALRMLVIGIGLVMLAGCKKSSNTHSMSQKHASPSDNDVSHKDLPFTDVSLPLGVQRLSWQKISNSTEQYVIHYVSSCTDAMLQDFYELDMERLGWRLLTSFSSKKDRQLIFDKPSSWCTISVSPSAEDENMLTVLIFIGPKV
jgi:uncharacterized lipoprotein YajG